MKTAIFQMKGNGKKKPESKGLFCKWIKILAGNRKSAETLTKKPTIINFDIVAWNKPAFAAQSETGTPILIPCSVTPVSIGLVALQK